MAKFEITEEQFAAALTAASKGGAESALEAVGYRGAPSPGVAQSPNEMFAAQMKAARVSTEPPLQIDRVEGVLSNVTGSRFTAVKVHGVVAQLEGYTYPDGIEKDEADGGLAPNRLGVRNKDGQLSPQFKQWRWENFYQLDLRTFVGKVLPAHVVKAA